MQSVGTISQLRRYPVKSMRGESLPATTLTLQGLPLDRSYAFVQKDSRSSFPWFTAREMPELLRYIPTVVESGPQDVEVSVTTPDGMIFPIQSDELRQSLEARSGKNLFLLHDYRGSFDVAPISLISCQTVSQIAKESDTEADSVRFRPNLLVDLHNGEAFEELNWIGRILRLGDAARIAILKVDQRCMMISLDPVSAKPNHAVQRCVVEQHNNSAGVYAAVLTPGEVRIGGTVSLES